MQIRSIDWDDRRLTLTWATGETSEFPHLWLRDNCPSAFHPQTGERSFDLLSVESSLKPATVVPNVHGVEIVWAGDGHVSRYDAGWLAARRPGLRREDPADVTPVTWGAGITAHLPSASASDLAKGGETLALWMEALLRYGIVRVTDVSTDAEAGRHLAESIGFLRQTNFGTVFEVVSMPDPNNQAYTSDALPLHTDLPNQELAPGIQFLHCLANEAEGGGSRFVDGFRVAEAVRDADPDAFHLLSTVDIPFRFHDRDYDIRSRSPVVVLGHDGRLVEVRFSPHMADTFDLPIELVEPYYRAFRLFMERTRDPSLMIATRLMAGEMVVFDNRRVLHGREAFRPNTGFRHLRGFYVDHGEFRSRLRVLRREAPAPESVAAA